MPSIAAPRRVRRQPVPIDNGEPMSNLNMTPLIDVLLVLLIMMMLSIPMMMHKTEVTLPTPGVADGPPPPIHSVRVEADAVRWDGQAVTRAELSRRLAAAAVDEARPLIRIDAEPRLPYGRFAWLITTVRKAGVKRVTFADQSGFAAFRAAQTRPR